MEFKPTGAELLYFLTLNSDIVQENLGPNLNIKRVESEDWRLWFGVEVQLHKGIFMGYTKIGIGPYTHASRMPDEDDIVGLKLYEHNYVLIGTDDSVRREVKRFDRAIRLFRTGNAGISSGFSNTILQAFHPKPGWRELPSTILNKADIPELKSLADRIDAITENKASLVIDRYRNATKKKGVEDYNRFVDLVTILEMLFVPDGSSGEIGYKLRMRASSILSTAIGLSAEDTILLIKRLYNMRSSIVHAGKVEQITTDIWVKLTNLCRVGILEYLKDPDRFTATALDTCLIN